jgi:methyltransferase (TIGR00027 family)
VIDVEDHRDSITSLISAFSRAYHCEHDSPIIFDDFIAKNLISQEEFLGIRGNLVQNIPFFNKEVADRCRNDQDEILRWITQVQLSPITLSRSAYCEKALFNELQLGLKQYVILGAGLDTFCFRHPELTGRLDVFEIDFPSTQDFKKQRLNNAQLEIPNHLHFVPMDFTKRFSDASLLQEGFRHEKTFFSFLGVSYYLTKDEIKSLFQHVFSLVPSGSSIVFDYADDRLFSEEGRSNRVKNMVNMAAAGGEPMKSCFSYEEIEHLLDDIGLLIYEHLSPDDINEQFFSNRTDDLSAFETVHYMHAVKKL